MKHWLCMHLPAMSVGGPFGDCTDNPLNVFMQKNILG